MKTLLKWFLRALKGVFMFFWRIYLLLLMLLTFFLLFLLLLVGVSFLMPRQESAQVDTTAPTLSSVTLPSINAAPIDCTNTGNLIPSNIGKVCTDESIYAGQSDSYYLFTTRSGCGYEYAGTSSTAPTTNFTPTCTGSADSMTKQYSIANTKEGATSTTDGLTNTNTLVETMPSLFNPAAAYCYYLNLHGQTDWYLPSKDELDVLHTNRTAIGGFYSDWREYSSSSEIDDQTAWILNVSDELNDTDVINDDDQYNHFKSTPVRVRCVRRLK
jgi:hypothetical protein